MNYIQVWSVLPANGYYEVIVTNLNYTIPLPDYSFDLTDLGMDTTDMDIIEVRDLVHHEVLG